MIVEWEHSESGCAFYRAGPRYLGEVWSPSAGVWLWRALEDGGGSCASKREAMSVVESYVTERQS